MSLLDEIEKESPAFMNTIHLRRTSFLSGIVIRELGDCVEVVIERFL